MAAEMYSVAVDWIWPESFWLPKNVSWKDLERDENHFYPRPLDLLVPLPLAVVLFLVRLIWERFLATPLGRAYGIKESPPRSAVNNPVLENAYRKYKRIIPEHDVLEALGKQCDYTPRQVERWFRRRRYHGKPSEMQRFRETSWRFAFYFSIFWYGVAVLWNKPWFTDTKHCWYGYPKQVVDPEIYWYYMLELGFYWSLIISLFMDIKRKDFTEMIIHHIATILLMTLSWSNNMVRVGTLVLVVHDAVDYWLEGAKAAKYLKFHRFCDVLFVIFTVMWFVTRLVIYPFWVIKSTLFEGTTIVGPLASYFVFNGLLLILQVLHIIWFHLICKIAYNAVVRGEVERDGRSDTEPESDSEDDVITVNGKNAAPNKLLNGNNNLTQRKPDKQRK